MALSQAHYLNKPVYLDTVYNINLKRNIFFAKETTQFALMFHSNYNDVRNFGTADSNYYVRPIDDNSTMGERGLSTGYIYLYRTLAAWKLRNLKDANSSKSPKSISSTSELIFEYNASLNPKIISDPLMKIAMDDAMAMHAKQ